MIPVARIREALEREWKRNLDEAEAITEEGSHVFSATFYLNVARGIGDSLRLIPSSGVVLSAEEVAGLREAVEYAIWAAEEPGSSEAFRALLALLDGAEAEAS